MDAYFSLFAFGFSGLGFGLAGFTLGRVQRELRVRKQARSNLALANQRANQRAAAIRAAAHAVTDSDDDGDPDADASPNRHGYRDSFPYTGPVKSSPGRRAILRNHSGASPHRYVASGTVDFPNEAPLVASRGVVDYDC